MEIEVGPNLQAVLLATLNGLNLAVSWRNHRDLRKLKRRDWPAVRQPDPELREELPE